MLQWQTVNLLQKSRMTAQLIQAAMQHHQAGELQKAKAIYRRVLRKQPGNAEAMHLCGLVEYQDGKLDEAASLIVRAIRLKPSSIMHFNLAAVLRAQERPDDALEHYRQSLMLNPDYAEAREMPDGLPEKLAALQPDDAEAHNRLGLALYGQGLQKEALACFRRALALKPDSAEAYNNLGLTFTAQHRPNEAIECYRRALMLNPDYADACGNQGDVFLRWGQFDKALECYREQLRLEPDNASVRHQVESLSGTHTERAPNQYVQQLFDRQANFFDSFLQQELKYDIPREMAALITHHLNPASANWKVLDLGCGTGLGGLAIAPFASHLTGVDLSGNMLEKARARNLYQRLEQSDLLGMMQGEPDGSYDAVIATDVLVYFGKLDEVVAEIRRLLRPGGIFIFSVEAMTPAQGEAQESLPPYRLENTARYTHSSAYLTQLTQEHGFPQVVINATTIRQERGEPVAGYLAMLGTAAP